MVFFKGNSFEYISVKNEQKFINRSSIAYRLICSGLRIGTKYKRGSEVFTEL